ncbi:hypothetical protein D3C71_2202840 [compost metagenome]
MQSFADYLVCNMRAIEIAGVDVVDAAFHRLAQDSYGLRTIARRPENALACKLHRAIAQPAHRMIAKREGS